MVFSSIVLGLALLSKAAAGVRLMPGGASLIICLQFSLKCSISPPSSTGVAGVISAGVGVGISTGSGSGLASGSGAVTGGSGGGGVAGGGVDTDAVVAGASTGSGSGLASGSGAVAGGSGEGGVVGGVAIFAGWRGSALTLLGGSSSVGGRVQSTRASSRGSVE